ncbi:hypothetical protein J3R83DRAFT_13323, partial [Lanmaoa asiatica]
RRDPSRGDHVNEEKASRGDEVETARRSNGDGVRSDGKRCGTSGATGSARCDSKRVKTRLPAENVNNAPPKYPKLPTECVDSPRRRGRLK